MIIIKAVMKTECVYVSFNSPSNQPKVNIFTILTSLPRRRKLREVKKFEQGHRADRSRGLPGYDSPALYNTLKQILPRNGESELTGNV